MRMFSRDNVQRNSQKQEKLEFLQKILGHNKMITTSLHCAYLIVNIKIVENITTFIKKMDFYDTVIERNREEQQSCSSICGRAEDTRRRKSISILENVGIKEEGTANSTGKGLHRRKRRKTKQKTVMQIMAANTGEREKAKSFGQS